MAQSLRNPQLGQVVEISFLSSIVQFSRDAIFSTTSCGEITTWNPAAESLLGYLAFEVIGRSFELLVQLDQQLEVRQILERVLKGECIAPLETEWKRKDGTLASVSVSISALPGEAGEIAGISFISRKIPHPRQLNETYPERTAAEEALRESEARFRVLVEQNSEGVVLLDEKGVVIEWNRGKARITGIPTEDAIGKYFWDLQIRMAFPERNTPEGREEIKSTILQALQTGQSPLFDHPVAADIRRSDGQIVHVEQTIFPIKTSEGYRIGSLTQDIGERTRSMQAIRESGELFRASFENATAGVSLVGLDGKFIRINDKLSEILGYPKEELQRMTFNDVTHPEDKQIGLNFLSQMVNGQIDKALFEKRYIHKSGKVVWTSISTGIVRKNSGEPVYFVSHTQDITESKRVQQENQRRLMELEALHRVAIAGTAASSQNELFQQAIAAGQSLYFRDFGIGLIDEAAGIVRFPFYIKADGRHAPDTSLGQGVTGRVALTGVLIQLDDVSKDPGYIDADPKSRSELCVPIRVGDKVIGVINVESDRCAAFGEADQRILNALAGELGTALEKFRLYEKTEQLLDEQQQTNQRLIKAYNDTLEGWSRAMDQRDHETGDHSHRVAELTLRLAERLGIPENQFVPLRQGAQLHDIGKVGIPDEILLKGDKLTEAEWVVMRQHPEKALDFLSRIEYLQPALEIPYCHHERWDGSGYPQGLKGEEIPLFARIFMVVDVYDALTSDRPYRAAWSKQRALDYIQEESGKHFEPRMVEEFLMLMTADGSLPTALISIKMTESKLTSG